ncbi:Bromodomain-containing protein [Phascolomyces articulosus]|uniref:Bromodomain-containing protein n=1 Tax=Phascolomyces articulosus TaxID=60185 RepID=A0AAD5K3L6_9FUNG|nr:Bromodomain-containing protein [Phascolomyces articulosus]
MLGHSVCLPSPASIETEAASNMNPTTLSPADKRFISTTLSTLKKNKNSLYFREPVDPIALNCPDYFDIIKHPMDLSTAQSKLDNDQYDSIDAFILDMRLVFDNCHKYNNPADIVGQSGKKLEEAFEKCLLKRPSATVVVRDSQDIMPDDEFRLCENALIEMQKKKHSHCNWAFLNPVDATAWGATDYHVIIKRPMDLSTIEKKLNEFQYANEDEFVADVRLMFQNCYTYNEPSHPVHDQGKQLEKIFDTYWKKAHRTPSSKGVCVCHLHVIYFFINYDLFVLFWSCFYFYDLGKKNIRKIIIL